MTAPQEADGKWVKATHCAQGHEMTEENTYWRDYSKSKDSRSGRRQGKRYGTCIICRLAAQELARKHHREKLAARSATIAKGTYNGCPKCPGGGVAMLDEDGDPRCICGWQPTSRLVFND